MTILKLDGHSFFFSPHFSDLLLINQIKDPNRSPIGDWLPSSCIQDAETSEIGRRSFSACLKKGAVTSLSREAPFCNFGLGPSQDLYSLLKSGFKRIGPLYLNICVVKGD